MSLTTIDDAHPHFLWKHGDVDYFFGDPADEFFRDTQLSLRQSAHFFLVDGLKNGASDDAVVPQPPQEVRCDPRRAIGDTRIHHMQDT